MRYAWLFISVSWMSPVLSQEIKVSVENGYAVAAMSHAKRIMLYKGAGAGMRWLISERTALSIGFDAYMLQGGYTLNNTSQYDKRFFLQLPVAGERSYRLSRHSGGYIQAGVYMKKNVSSGTESRLNGIVSISREKMAGWNAGILFGIGFRTDISQRLSFAIGLRGQKDCWQKYSSREWMIKTEGTALVLCFYRK